MKKIILVILLFTTTIAFSQSNNPISIYEGETIFSVRFVFKNLPSDEILADNFKAALEPKFKIYPQTPYNSFLVQYYVAQINLIQFVSAVSYDVEALTQGGVAIVVHVTFDAAVLGEVRRKSVFRDVSLLPILYSSNRSFLTLKASASQMVYSNNNAWFAEPSVVLNGNPLVDRPIGGGYTGWLEGFGMAGLYGVVTVLPKLNLGLYGGVSYMISYSAGRELFTDKSRFYGGVEDAYVGVVGGNRTKNGHNYLYNVLYGRKQFVLGDGWLIVNTSMNGGNRAALQLNPRWATKSLFSAGFNWDRITLGIFRLQPDELPILNSRTVINGVNVELGNKDNILIGASFLQVPKSNFRYYHPNGDVTRREGMQVYNVRLFKSSKATNGGIFFKAEGGYERNSNFNMRSYAYYGELGWLFASTKGTPTFSYRFSYFSGDDPSTAAYERWDALYTGGNGEQWVQGSNMYKMVQNSNEMTHRFQAVYRPLRKMEMVGQVWLFYAPQYLNLGGNPALSQMSAKYYGTELNLTLKYFHSRRVYFHINTAWTLPGDAIKNNLPESKNWFCLSGFVRYSF